MQKSLGEILREYRKSKGLLIRQVGASLEIDPALLSKFETDARLPTQDQIKLFSKFYGDTNKTILIAYLSDKVASELENDEIGLKVMQVAEEKIKYKKFKTKKK